MPFDHRDLWSTAHVKTQLTSGPMSEGKTFLYFLAITGFDWLQLTAFRLSHSPEPTPTWGYFDAWFAFAITLAALVYLFLCNGGTRGSHFLNRYFPLSVVVGWKIVAASFVVLPAVKAALSGAPPSVIGWSLSAALATLNLVMFLRIGHHLKRLSGGGATGNIGTGLGHNHRLNPTVGPVAGLAKNANDAPVPPAG